MSDYIATFHTHLSAMLTCRALTGAGYEARMAPVPRQLSSSCGTCVFYCAPNPCPDLLDEDTERVYARQDEAYLPVLDMDAP